MNEQGHMRLYMLTSVACIGWLAQLIFQRLNDGAIFSASNIFLSICILIMIVYCSVCALQLWRQSRRVVFSGYTKSEKIGDHSHGLNGKRNKHDV